MRHGHIVLTWEFGGHPCSGSWWPANKVCFCFATLAYCIGLCAFSQTVRASGSKALRKVEVLPLPEPVDSKVNASIHRHPRKADATITSQLLAEQA